MNLNVGIIGATGHTGEMLIEILLKHPHVKIAGLYNTGKTSGLIGDIFPRFKNQLQLTCSQTDLEHIRKECELVFLALPHTASMDFAPKLLSMGKRVIDLSADYRLENNSLYELFYKTKHKDKEGLKQAVYGLPELYKAKIKAAKLVANPGCYPTCALLGLAPLVSVGLGSKGSTIIIDAKSGVSGAGKKVEKDYLFSEIQGDFRAYKVDTHQHAPEIEQVLSKLAGEKIKITFVPHLLPIDRGILSTIYIKKPASFKGKPKDILKFYKKFYKSEPFVRIKAEGEFPRLKDVVGTNFCDIGIKDTPELTIIISAIDNLLKGASAQAVQNMNIMYKFPESCGLL